MSRDQGRGDSRPGLKQGCDMVPQKRGYLNEFDDAVPPQELRDVREMEGGLIYRVWNGSRHGWTFRYFGSISPTSRAMVRHLGFRYQSRKWTCWDAPLLAQEKDPRR